ncbi:MAG: crossover junction endodeoxyribonuclease RuvC [Dehalococcoidia bacterium]|nr:crossover junction endodeoxyribonuclease RuvC [Dehalococcoidia bacterium]
MIILGVDPGTIQLGYGVVSNQEDTLTALTYGVVKCRGELPKRLCHLYDELSKVIAQYRPDALAIETPFVSENARSALAIGKAQAVAILAAAQCAIPVSEYPPAVVKRHVADYGASSKEQVQTMVRLLLEMTEPPQPFDAADALAIAICHARELKLKEIKAGAQ